MVSNLLIDLTGIDLRIIPSALRSPSLLELSGIGNKDVLNSLGIEVKIHNSAVGENVQEHSNATLIFGE